MLFTNLCFAQSCSLRAEEPVVKQEQVISLQSETKKLNSTQEQVTPQPERAYYYSGPSHAG